MRLSELRRSLGRQRTRQWSYAAQAAYVRFMLDLSAQLLVAGGELDPVIMAELSGFPEGLVIGFSVLGSDIRVRLRVRRGRFEVIDRATPAQLEITFKHVRHAFLVFGFVESTPQAFANERMVLQGDVALSMRFVRCLNRVQAVALPEFVARRALKSVPPLGVAERIGLNARLYAQMVRTFRRTA